MPDVLGRAEESLPQRRVARLRVRMKAASSRMLNKARSSRPPRQRPKAASSARRARSTSTVSSLHVRYAQLREDWTRCRAIRKAWARAF